MSLNMHKTPFRVFRFPSSNRKFPPLLFSHENSEVKVDRKLKLLAGSRKKLERDRMGKKKQYWLLKTEPCEWSWSDQEANGGESKWDGVKNKQAQKNLKAMRLGDLCFFYHSGSKSRRVVGVVRVAREWYDEDDTSGGGAVDVVAVGEMRTAVDLKDMKEDEGMKGFMMFRQPRLSVVPVDEGFWVRVCDLGNGFEGDGRDCLD